MKSISFLIISLNIQQQGLVVAIGMILVVDWYLGKIILHVYLVLNNNGFSVN